MSHIQKVKNGFLRKSQTGITGGSFQEVGALTVKSLLKISKEEMMATTR